MNKRDQAVIKTSKVLFLVDKSGFGGVQTIARTVFDKFRNPDISIDFFYLRNLNHRFNMEDIKASNVFYSKSTSRYSIKPLFEVIDFVKRNKPEIIHCNGNKSIIFGIIIKTFYAKEVKIIAHEHGGVFDNAGWYFLLLNVFKSKINIFITLTNFRKILLIKRSKFNEEKILVLNNFVDEQKYFPISENDKNKLKKTYGLDDMFVIGYLAGISRIKGWRYFIEALTFLDFKYKAVVAGDGPDLIKMKAYATELNLSENIIFLGYTNKPSEIFHLFSVYILPSLKEFFGLTLIESMSSGIPSIVSGIDELKEITNDHTNCLLFKPEDSLDLSLQIKDLHKNEVLCEKIKKGAMETVKKYSLQKYLYNLNEAYKNVK